MNVFDMDGTCEALRLEIAYDKQGRRLGESEGAGNVSNVFSLYRTTDFWLHLHVTRDQERVTLIGNLGKSQDPVKALKGIFVLLLIEGRESARTTSDLKGSFRLCYYTREAMTLQVVVGGVNYYVRLT